MNERPRCGIVGEAQVLGLKVVVWTVNSEAGMRSMMALNVDGIISDYPDRLRRVAGEKVVARIRREPDAAIMKIVEGWPRNFDPNKWLVSNEHGPLLINAAATFNCRAASRTAPAGSNSSHPSSATGRNALASTAKSTAARGSASMTVRG